MRKEYYPKAVRGSEVKVEGPNQNRLLGELLKRGITVYNLRRKSRGELCLKVKNTDFTEFVALAEKLGFKVTVEKKLGAVSAAFRMLPRLGLVVALVLLTACYFIASSFVWRVEIVGNERVDYYAISDVLAAAGAKTGANKKGLDFGALERDIRGIEGIAEATVTVSGTTLKVSVVESLEFVPRPNGGKEMLVSLYDAEITRIVLRKGSALVKTGQRVFAGTPLLSGNLIGTDGEIITGGVVDGEVYGKVVFRESVTVALRGVRTVATGNEKKSTILGIFGLSIGKRRDGFELADVREETRTLAPIPFKVTTLYAKELTREEYSLDRDEAVEEAKNVACSRLAERLVGPGGEETVIVRDVSDGVICVDVYITSEILIT